MISPEVFNKWKNNLLHRLTLEKEKVFSEINFNEIGVSRKPDMLKETYRNMYNENMNSIEKEKTENEYKELVLEIEKEIIWCKIEGEIRKRHQNELCQSILNAFDVFEKNGGNFSDSKILNKQIKEEIKIDQEVSKEDFLKSLTSPTEHINKKYGRLSDDSYKLANDTIISHCFENKHDYIIFININYLIYDEVVSSFAIATKSFVTVGLKKENFKKVQKNEFNVFSSQNDLNNEVKVKLFLKNTIKSMEVIESIDKTLKKPNIILLGLPNSSVTYLKSIETGDTDSNFIPDNDTKALAFKYYSKTTSFEIYFSPYVSSYLSNLSRNCAIKNFGVLKNDFHILCHNYGE
uniref:Maelstrom domain-containing protein n=1 Tax=Strongyloides venezuelensis TaxID=75913 RepID=A0A0K0F0H0_STRVS